MLPRLFLVQRPTAIDVLRFASVKIVVTSICCAFDVFMIPSNAANATRDTRPLATAPWLVWKTITIKRLYDLEMPSSQYFLHKDWYHSTISAVSHSMILCIRYVFFSVIGVALQIPRFREKRLEKVRQRCNEILHVELPEAFLGTR